MRRTILLIYALIFVTESLQAALVPLLPRFAHEFGLSDVETGSLLSAATLATVVIGVPIGLLSDRLGAKTLAVAAAFIVGTAAIMQAFAPNYGVLFAGRLLFGIGFGTAWTAGVVVVSGASNARRAVALGGIVTAAGFAHFIVPVIAGSLAESVGIAVPFLAIGIVAFAVGTLLALSARGVAFTDGRQPLLEALRAARGEHRMEGALLLMAVLGIMAGAVPLLVPLQLDRNGLSASEIGTLFSLASGLWVAASFFVARLGDRAVAVRTAGLGVVALAAVVLVPLATAATAALAAFLVLRATLQSPLSTICYPLAESGGRRAGIGRGTAVGLANVVWGATAVTTPVVAGALAGVIGERWTFGAVAVICGALGARILVTGHRERNELDAALAEPA
jgi:MFS transporter, DHA1 family, tetracycline resistance protein